MTANGRGILITNLGSPAEPTPKAVKDYLEEFLMDPYVITLPRPLRYLVVKAITRKRPISTAAAYARIWTDSGGPLRDHSERLAAHVRSRTDLPVAVGMRYGKPSFEAAYFVLRDVCNEVLVVSPYPQYATSTYVSMVEHARKVFQDKILLVTKPYFDNAAFLGAHVEQLSEHLPPDTEHLLFSFHGVPEQHIRQADTTRNHCLRRDDCCALEHPVQSACYRYQCLKTAELISASLSIPSSVCFQSRLGRAAWLKPYTIERVRELAASGLRKVAVLCPSFVADNLETLHEIGQEMRQVFLDAGGHRLDLMPSLNESDLWVPLVVEWCTAPSAEHERI